MNNTGLKLSYAVSLLLLFTATLTAGISSADAQETVLNQILADNLDKIEAYELSTLLNQSEPLQLIFLKKISSPYSQSWVYFVDDHVGINWEHACRYIFVDEASGDYTVVNEMKPPLDLSVFGKIVEHEISGSSKLETNPEAEIKYRAPDDHNYAVIINGGGNEYYYLERNWNDISAMYCALTQNQGYKSENIFVHSTDGSKTYNRSLDLDGPLINPGSVDIDAPATKESLQSTFDYLADVMGPDDQLFLFVTDGGGLDEISYDHRWENYMWLWEDILYGIELSDNASVFL